ncbi:lipoyl synthase [Buchnera aphidicola (Kurisakia onigurumii)]|uniref:lipoyl synthase n=1 Tax=Buchnera aphidicola TaxID=9 RepID=UPI0031B6A233
MNKNNFIPIQFRKCEINKNFKKPSWIKIKLPSSFSKIIQMKNMLRKLNLNSVCEEAQCPNLSECFNSGTVTFMILGSICTRKCPFCAVSKGRPNNPDVKEPKKLKKVISKINIQHVVLTSVNRDDLKDGGSGHFLKSIQEIRKIKKQITIEILVPDFRSCLNLAVKTISQSSPDIFNHNLENVPRLYKKIRPGANYLNSLKLLELFKFYNPNVPTKSGIMLGLGEKLSEIVKVMKDLYNVGVSMITIGQYLQPTSSHLPVKRYITPLEFKNIKEEAISIGFNNVFSGPLVRSSYHAKDQYKFF